jgi:hypothetical protein
MFSYRWHFPGFLQHLAPLVVALVGTACIRCRTGHEPISTQRCQHYNQLVGDYTNPILQPRAAQIVNAL